MQHRYKQLLQMQQQMLQSPPVDEVAGLLSANPDLQAQLQAAGIDPSKAASLLNNPQVRTLTEKGVLTPAQVQQAMKSFGIGGAGEITSMIAEFKSALPEMSENATPEQRSQWVHQIGAFIKEQAYKSGTFSLPWGGRANAHQVLSSPR